MRNLIYILALVAIWLFSACHDITVGYLNVDPTAGYAQDTLHVFNIKKEIQRLKDLQEAFKAATVEFQEELARLEEKKEVKEQEADAFREENLDPLEDDMDNWTDDDPMWDVYWDVYNEWDEVYNTPIWELDDEITEVNNQLAEIADEMGLEAPEIVSKKLEEYQNKIDFKLPWVTPKIEGILGTEPLIYTVIRVKNENAENAAKFMNYVGTMGGGTIYVNIDIDVPVGAYTVTLQVENEGRTKILEDIFTFVVDAEGSDEVELPEE